MVPSAAGGFTGNRVTPREFRPYFRAYNNRHTGIHLGGRPVTGSQTESIIITGNQYTLKRYVMQVQYVYDEQGKKTSVIVPISLWQKISRQKKVSPDNRAFNPAQYRGIYRNLGIDIGRELGVLRQEWERT